MVKNIEKMIEVSKELSLIERHIASVDINEQEKNEIKDKIINLINTNEVSWHFERYMSIIKKIKIKELENILYQEIIRYYKSNYDWSDYENCISDLLAFYECFGYIPKPIDKFYDRLSWAISMAGDSTSSMKAFNGISKIKKYIHILNEEDLIRLLNEFESITFTANDGMRIKQLSAIIDNANISEQIKSQFKGFYIDRWYLEQKITKVITHTLNRIYKQYINIEVSYNKYDLGQNKEYLQKSLIHKNDPLKKIEFSIEYKNIGWIKFIIKGSGLPTITLIEVDLNYKLKIISTKTNMGTILNVKMDQSVHDDFDEYPIIEEIKNTISEAFVEKFKDDYEAYQPRIYINETVVKAINSANQMIINGLYAEAIDRVHTVLHGYLKKICELMETKYSDEFKLIFKGKQKIESANITTLYKFVQKVLLAEDHNAEDVEKILRAFANIIDELNSIRNNKSLAHPNNKLLGSEEALVVLRATNCMFRYIDEKLALNSKYPQEITMSQ